MTTDFQNNSGENCPVEAIENPPQSIALTDDLLKASGLVRVAAYVRSEKTGTGNAKRVSKAREKAKAMGVAQVNVLAPISAHQIIKTIATALQGTATPRQALEDALLAEISAQTPGCALLVRPAPEIAAIEQLSRRLEKLTGFRLFIARLLGLI